MNMTSSPAFVEPRGIRNPKQIGRRVWRASAECFAALFIGALNLFRISSFGFRISYSKLSIGVALAGCIPFFCRGEAIEPAFDSANKLYGQGKFTEAASAYEQILKSGRASTAVYFNLGNAFFKAGQIGRAICAYRQARGVAPRDPDVLANLQFARSQVQGPTLSSAAWQRWLGGLSLNEWTLFAAVSLWAWLLTLMLPQWRPGLKPVLRGWTIALGILAAVLCACLGADYYRARIIQSAVVISHEAVVHQAPLAESPGPLKLNEGAEVRILDHKEDWVQVTTDPRRIGWVRRDELLLANGD
jgi:tetratricopeptide (TPR) repeat protein